MRRGRGLRAVMAAALAFAVLCVAGFGWLLALRTCWRGDRLRLAAEVTLSDAGGGNTRAEWTLDGKHYGYTLSGVLPFSHLEQYVDNLVRGQADGEAKGEGENG